MTVDVASLLRRSPINPWSVDGTILHVGPVGQELFDLYLSTSANQLVLASPDISGLAEVRSTSEFKGKVHPLNIAVRECGGKVQGCRHSSAALDVSLNSDEFARKYPGARFMDNPRTQTRSVASLVSQFESSEHLSNIAAFSSLEGIRGFLEEVSANNRYEKWPHIFVFGGPYLFSRLERSDLLSHIVDNQYTVVSIMQTTETSILIASVCSSVFERARHANREKALKRSYIELRKVTERLRIEMKNSKSDTTAESSADSREIEMRDLRQRIKGLEDDLAIAREEGRSLQVGLKAETDERKRSVSARSVLAKQNGDLRGRNRRAQIELAEMQEQRNEVREELTKIEAQLELLKDFVRDIQTPEVSVEGRKLDAETQSG